MENSNVDLEVLVGNLESMDSQVLGNKDNVSMLSEENEINKSLSSKSRMEKMDGRLDIMDVRLNLLSSEMRDGFADIRKMLADLMVNKESPSEVQGDNKNNNIAKDLKDYKGVVAGDLRSVKEKINSEEDIRNNTQKLFTKCEEHKNPVNNLICNVQISKGTELKANNNKNSNKYENQNENMLLMNTTIDNNTLLGKHPKVIPNMDTGLVKDNNFIQDGDELVYFSVYDDVIPMTMEEYMEYEMEISNEVSEDISYDEDYILEETVSSRLNNLCTELGHMLGKKFDANLYIWKLELIHIGNKVTEHTNMKGEFYGSGNLYKETVYSEIQNKILWYEEKYKILSAKIESYIKSSITNVTSSKSLSDQECSLTNKLPTIESPNLNVSDKLIKEPTSIVISENKDGLISYGFSETIVKDDINLTGCDNIEVNSVEIHNTKSYDMNNSILEVHSYITNEDVITLDSAYDMYLELGGQTQTSQKVEYNIGDVQCLESDMIYKLPGEVYSSNLYSQTTNISDGMIDRKLFQEDSNLNIISNTYNVFINTSSDNIQTTDKNLIHANMVISDGYNYKGDLDDRGITTDYTYMGSAYNKSYINGLESKSIVDGYACKDICMLHSMDSNSGVNNNINHILDNNHVGENSDVMFSNNHMSIINHEASGDLLYNNNNSKINGNNNTYVINSKYTWNDLDFSKSSKYIKGRRGFEDILMGTHIYS